MGKFYLTDGTYLVATGECPDGMEELQSFGGYAAMKGDPPDWLKKREAPAMDYTSMRALEYPSIGQQLDWLWHAMHTGDMPAIEPFYSSIKAVKDKYPKPSN